MKKLLKVILGSNSDQADYFAKKYKKIIKVTSNKNGYIYVWDKVDLLWKNVEDETIENFITDFLRKKVNKCVKYAEKNKDENTRKLIKKLEKTITSVKYATPVWKRAKAILLDKDFVNKLNKKPKKLPIANGKVINLKTGKVRDRKCKDYFSIECPVKFLKDDDKLKNANKFLSDICGDNKEYKQYMLRYLGYCLTGYISDRSFGQFYGFGRNGKTKLTELMKIVLGDFFTALASEIFVKTKMDTGKGQASSYLMPLKHARFGVFSESEEGSKLNAGLIKSISGGDPLTAREIYKTQTTFITQCKLVIMTNHRLEFNASDKAITDRLRYFPFTQDFVKKPKKDNERKADDNFIKKMQTDYIHEFFTLLVKEGSMKWFKNKNFEVVPNIIKDELKDYLGEMDIIQQFISESCVVDKEKTISRSVFHKAFGEWCKINNYKAKSTNELVSYMKKSYNTKQIKSIRTYMGVTLKSLTNDD